MPAVLEKTIENGAARKLNEILRQFDASADYVSVHHDELLDDYEDKWVAVSPQGVIASSVSRAGLRRSLKKRPEPGNTLYVTFLTRQRQTLIL